MLLKLVAMAAMIAPNAPALQIWRRCDQRPLPKLARQAYVSRMRNRGFLHTVDNGLLVIAAVVVAIIAFKVLGAVVGFAWFLAKIAIVTLVVAGVWRGVNGRRHELDGHRDRELYR
jgi:hypothetical protein